MHPKNCLLLSIGVIMVTSALCVEESCVVRGGLPHA